MALDNQIILDIIQGLYQEPYTVTQLFTREVTLRNDEETPVESEQQVG